MNIQNSGVTIREQGGGGGPRRRSKGGAKWGYW